ncbi:hypothetical protein AB0F72_08330 [Actinoplanes sp. NPDC023936]|uniref:hypothetical protein n=1 Tax=Actinoplanes sp. NPDC023936 TaxID=3154910 RepID=UPI0033E5AAD4
MIARKIRDLKPGDGVDLLAFPADYPFDETTRSVAEYQTAEVVGDNDGSPFTVESDNCWVLHTTEGSFGIHPDWEVEVSA